MSGFVIIILDSCIVIVFLFRSPVTPCKSNPHGGNPDIDWLARLVQDAVQLAGVGVVHKEQTCVRSTKLLGRRGCARCSFTRLSPPPTSGVAFIDPLARAGILGIDQDVRLPELVRAYMRGSGQAHANVISGWAPCRQRCGSPAGRHSKAMRAILATWFNCPVGAAGHERASAAGTALTAAVRVELYRDMTACVTCRIAQAHGEVEQPDLTLARAHELLFPIYRDGCAAMPNVWHQMHADRETICGV